MKNLFLFGVFLSILISSLAYGGEYNCKQGYPNVAKKDGSYDTRKNDLWELAQDWVHFRNRMLLCNRQGDEKCVEEARRHFQQTNEWLAAYPENQVSEALSLAEDCWLKNH